MAKWYLYVAIFLTAFIVCLLTTPLSKKIAIKLGAMDVPKARGLNKVPKPRMGGIAIVLGFFASLLVALPFVPELHTKQFIGFIVGAIIIIILGMADDINPIPAKKKFVVQILSALIVVFSGTVISFSGIKFIDHIPFLGEFATIIWIVGLTNAVNLIDGIDGLAAGVAGICSMCIFVLCVITGSPLAVVFTAGLAGASLGFLPRNFSPSELIMGDVGSTFLGYVLAVSSILGVFKGYAVMSILIAVLVLALPIFDTSFAMVRRMIDGRPIMSPDRGHLHHRLVDKGYSHKSTVIILYAISIVCGVVAISIAVNGIYSLIVVILFILLLFSIIHLYNKRLNVDNNNEVVIPLDDGIDEMVETIEDEIEIVEENEEDAKDKK